MSRTAFALRLAFMAMFFSVAAFAVFAAPDSPPQKEPDYEAMANCIAEYDYHHYNSNMMTNLEKALALCVPDN